MERKIYALMLLIMAWANKYIKSKIGEISRVIRNFMEKERVVLSVSFKFLVAVSCLFFSVAEVEAQVCSGGVRFDGINGCLDQEVDKYFFKLIKGDAVNCNESLDGPNMYYVSDDIYNKYGVDANGNPYQYVHLPDNAIDDPERTFFMINPGMGNGYSLTLKIPKSGYSNGILDVSFRFYFGNVSPDEDVVLNDKHFQVGINDNMGIQPQLTLVKDNCSTNSGASASNGGGVDLNLSGCGEAYGWFTVRVYKELTSEHMKKDYLEFGLNTNFSNQSKGDVLFVEYVRNNNEAAVCVDKGVACPGDVLHLTQEIYPVGTDIAWKYRYPDVSQDWLDVDDPSAGFLFNPDGEFKKQHLQFKAVVTLVDGTLSETDVLDVVTSAECKPQVSVSPSVACAGDDVNLKTKYYPANSEITWEYRYPGSSDWATIPSGSFISSSGDETSTPFTYNPPQGVSSAEFRAKAKLQDGTVIESNVVVVSDDPYCICDIEELVITESGLYNWAYYDLNGNRLSVNCDLNSPSCWNGRENVVVKEVLYDHIMNNGGVVIKAEKYPNKYEFVFKKGKNCGSLEILGDEPITICEGETPTVTYQLKGAAGTYNYVAKLYDKNNVEVNTISGSWTTTADPADVSLILPGNISFGEYSLKLSVNDQEFDAVTRTVTVKELPKVVVSSDPICAGTSDAPEVTITPSEGMTFEWVDAPTWSSLSAGTHTVSYKVTSDNGCFVEGTTDVTVEAPIVFELAKAGPICKGESVELKVDGNVIGVVANIDAYQWYEGGVAIPGATSATYTASPESTTEYSLTIKGNKCEATTKSVEVEVEEPIVFELAKAGPICKGESVELKVDGNVIGVVANTDAYQWYEGGIAIPGATGATYTASPESTTEYSLTIRGNKCEATTKSVKVEVEEPIVFELAKVEAICEGESVELKVDGAVTGTLAENNAYQWYKGSEKIEGATSPSYELQNATVTASADYTLTVSGKKCKSVSKTVSVVVKELPDADLTAEPICQGLTVAPKVPGNWISGWNYGWINEPAWETLSVGVHKQKYVVTAPNGCSAEGEMDVTVEEPIQITMPKVETLCVGAFVELTPTSVTGTLANNPYSWKGGGQTSVEKTFRVEKLCETITCILTVKGNACPEKSEKVQVPVVRPELKEPWPANKEGQEVCFSDGDFSPIKSETEIQALYGPDCNTVKVTFTEAKKEDDCGWYKKRTYVVTDACQHNVSPANPVIEVSGGDKEAPTLSGSLEKLAATGCDVTAAPKAYTTIAELAAAGLTISDNCSADFTISSKDVETSSNCSIVVTRTYTIADACGNPATAEQEITIKRADFKMSENGSATVQCASEAKAAGEAGSKIVLPDVEDACGNKLTGVLKEGYPTEKPDCEGTVTYVYTFTDCAGHAHDWEFVYKIAKPKLTIPSDGGSDVACLKDVKDPTAEALTDNCGRTVTAVANGERVVNIGTDGNGTVTYNFTYTDCSGSTYPWKYVYNVKADAFTPETDGASTVNCVSEATAPTLPTITVCGQPVVLTKQADSPKDKTTNGCGTYVYAYDYTVNGQVYVWTYTYTVTPKDFTMPDNAGTTISCASELKAPALPKVEDACGNVLSPIGEPQVSETPKCEGTVTYVYTYKDCADHSHDWTYTYTIEKPRMTFSGSIVDVEGVNACYTEEQKNKLLTADAVKAMYTSSCNREITVTPTDEIESKSDCGWKITRTYTISDGGCNTTTKTMSVSGSDKTAPALEGTWPDNILDQNNCVANADTSDLMSDEDVKALYKDCGTFEVTHADATTGDDCGWTVTRTYTIKDKCNNATTKTMSVSGSDKTVPELTGTWPKDIVDQDNCVANADITGLMSDADVKALYKDCSTFEVTHADATTGDDCSWTVTRTYTIKDKCNNATTKTMSVSGSDKTAPALEGTWPKDISDQNTCFANADLSGLKDVDYIKGIYSDVCGDVNVTYSEEKNETDCGWSVKRTYLISDFCKNSVSTSVTVSGKDAEKPVITTTAVSGDKGCNPTIVAPTFTVTDNCDNNVQVQVTTTGVQGAGYKKTQTWTATAKDVCGNSAEPVVIVYTWIEDSSTPFAVQMPADMVICQGSSVKLIPTIQGDPTSFSWKQGGTEVSTDETYTATPNETTTYHFTAVANECISSSGSVTITVEDPISFDLNEKDLVICEGTSVSLEPINIQGDLAQAPYSWTKNGVVVSSAAKLTDTPSANATYELTISGNKCAKARKSVSVTVEKQPSVHLRLSDNEVCEDENVTLQVTYSNVLGLEWLSKGDSDSEFTVFANNLSATNEVVATNDIMYQVRSTGNQACPAVVSDAVALTVEPKMEISLPSEIAICSKDEKTIEAAFSRTPTSIVWMVKNANAANYHQTKFTEAKIVVNPNVSSYYKVIASSKNCPTAEAEVLLKVEEIPNWEILSKTNIVCEGDEVELSTDLPSDYNFVWEAKTHGSANYERLPESTSKLYDSPMESTTYRLSVQTSAGCSAGSKLYDVKVDKPVYGSIADIAICDGDSGRLSVFVDDKSSYSYYWSDMPDYSNILSRQTSVRVAPKTTTSYYLKIVNGVCTTEYEAEAEVRTLPEIVGIEDMGNRMYRIQVEGGSVPYSYTWGKNSMPTSSDIMERPTYGMTYNVTVTDAIGCKVSDVVEVPTYELEIPEYFFPEIEKWKVKNLDRFYGSKVTIYDRFGKMLREYDVDQFNGWDGTYLGSPMPSTDYWYVISIQELDKELVGHFTLRRRNK